MRQSQRHHRRPPQPRAQPERGSVILFVLGMILLTSFMLMRFIDRAHTELLTEARSGQQIPLRHEAYSALQVTFAVLADITEVDEGLHSPDQGWGAPLEYADYQPPEGIDVAVTVTDESGKLSLPTADATALNALLVAQGLLESNAERITDAILSWTRPDHPSQFSESSEDTYLRHDPALTMPHQPLRSFDELRLMPAVRDLLLDENGNWNEIGQRFLESVSLFSFDKVNLNTGHPDVLSAFGLTDTILRALEDRRTTRDGRDPPRPYRSIEEAGTDLGQLPGNSALGTDAQILRVTITASQGARRFQIVAVIQSGKGNRKTPTPKKPGQQEEKATSEPRPWTSNSIDSPFQILEIQENDGF